MKYRMRFDGQDYCHADKRIKKWKKGDIVEGEFHNLLDDTYKPHNTMAKRSERPITTKRNAVRSSDFTVKEAKEKMKAMTEVEKEEFLKGETRKSL